MSTPLSTTPTMATVTMQTGDTAYRAKWVVATSSLRAAKLVAILGALTPVDAATCAAAEGLARATGSSSMR